MSTPWTTPEQIRGRVQRRWQDGTLLRAYAAGEPFPTIEVPLRGPKASQIGDDLAAVQDWIAALEQGHRDQQRYTLSYVAVGGRLIGRNEIPSRAIVSTYDQAWSLLGAGAQVRRFDQILALAGQVEQARTWMIRYPLKAIELGERWPAVLAALDWLDSARGSGAFLRQISAPGVDTKFVESHRSVLAPMLGVSANAQQFITDLGLRTKPAMVRFRFAALQGLPAGLTEVTGRVEEIAALDLDVRTVVVVENEITYLTLPVPPQGIVLWGKGFVDNRLVTLPFLADAEVLYWGDLDTSGFAILHQVRSFLPQTRSFLMDEQTLLAHRDRWVREPSPTSANLGQLTASESAVYTALLQDHHGERVRLEQERIDWGWARERLPYGSGDPQSGTG